MLCSDGWAWGLGPALTIAVIVLLFGENLQGLTGTHKDSNKTELPS